MNRPASARCEPVGSELAHDAENGNDQHRGDADLRTTEGGPARRAEHHRNAHRLERRGAKLPRELGDRPLELAAVGTAVEMHSNHPLLELRELAVEHERDLATDALANER